MAKVRFDYAKVGLIKKDGKVTFNGKSIKDLPIEAQEWCANYGLFVAESRTLAGHEKDTIDEKKALLQEKWDWLMAGMPKVERTREDAFTTMCNKVYNSDAPEEVKRSTIAGLEFAAGKKYNWPETEPAEDDDEQDDDE